MFAFHLILLLKVHFFVLFFTQNLSSFTLHILKQECFESLLSILHWSWTTLVLGVEELRGLKGFQYTATLLDLERLRFVGTCCLRLLRVYTCEIYPISGIFLNSLVSYLSANNNIQDRTLTRLIYYCRVSCKMKLLLQIFLLEQLRDLIAPIEMGY